MAVCMVFDVRGGTQAQYDQIVAKLGPGLQPGQISHFAGPVGESWFVVDVWESEEAANTFFRDTFQHAVAGTGFPSAQSTVFPVYHMER